MDTNILKENITKNGFEITEMNEAWFSRNDKWLSYNLNFRFPLNKKPYFSQI